MKNTMALSMATVFVATLVIGIVTTAANSASSAYATKDQAKTKINIQNKCGLFGDDNHRLSVRANDCRIIDSDATGLRDD